MKQLFSLKILEVLTEISLEHYYVFSIIIISGVERLLEPVLILV